MVQCLAGLCILTFVVSFPVSARQDVPRPLPFKFKVGQSMWLESYEFPTQFEGVLLQVMAHGDSVKPGGIGIVHRGPIWVCGDMEDILLMGSTFRSIVPIPRPDAGAGPQEPAPDRLQIERQPVVSRLAASPVWRVFPAPAVKSAMETGFKKQKKFKIADSADTADFIFWILAVPALNPVPGGASDRKTPLLSSALALAIPREHFKLKQAQLQVLEEPLSEQTSVSLSQKQQQLYDLIKDVPWAGVALGLGRGIGLKEGIAELSLKDLIRCFHKEARRY